MRNVLRFFLLVLSVCFLQKSVFAQIDSTHINPLDTIVSLDYGHDSFVRLTDSISVLKYRRDSLTYELLKYAKTFLGVPYRWAGKSRAGFDCSGYVMTMYAHLGVSLSPSAADMAGSGRVVPDSLLRPGDILFFVNTQRRRGGIGHVGLVYEISDGEVLFIHSACNGGVRFDYLSSPYYKSHYYRAERVPLMDLP